MDIIDLEKKWNSYIEETVNTNFKHTLDEVVRQMFKNFVKVGNNECKRILSLGIGAGNIEREYLLNGWYVTGVDIADKACDAILHNIENDVKNRVIERYEFIWSAFEEVKLSGYYNYVIAFNSLPYSFKEDLPNIISNVNNHVLPGSVFALTFFGDTHDFVKKTVCYGVSEEEIPLLFTGWEIKHINRVIETINIPYVTMRKKKKRYNPVVWDSIDVIAVKIWR